MNTDLELALRLADRADAITLAQFRAPDLRIEVKPDGTPVSDADRRTEEVLRDALRVERPGHAVLGEEFGLDGDSEWRWLIDPIDGTKNYVRGVPVWATLLALCHGDQTVVGVVSAPALQRRWCAARGEGAHSTATGRMRVSDVASIDAAHLSFTDLRDFARYGRETAFRTLTARCRHVRAFGDFWTHMLVAEGALDIGIEPVVNPWDIAAIQVIVEESGGRLSDFGGKPRIDSGNVITSNGVLHEEIIALIRDAAG